MVVLHEMRINTYAAHLPLIEAFQKEAAVIAKDDRIHDQNSWNLRRFDSHERFSLLARISRRYSP